MVKKWVSCQELQLFSQFLPSFSSPCLTIDKYFIAFYQFLLFHGGNPHHCVIWMHPGTCLHFRSQQSSLFRGLALTHYRITNRPLLALHLFMIFNLNWITHDIDWKTGERKVWWTDAGMRNRECWWQLDWTELSTDKLSDHPKGSRIGNSYYFVLCENSYVGPAFAIAITRGGG
jgi:hypothetical protein